MDDQLKDGNADQERPIDPLRRVFIPKEHQRLDGIISFQTLDHTQYQRYTDGSIRRIHPKVNGKVARKLRRGSK